jgi:hypothetical protein
MVKRPLKVLRIAAALYKPIYLIEAESGKVVTVFTEGKVAGALELGVCRATLCNYCDSGQILKNQYILTLKTP